MKKIIQYIVSLLAGLMFINAGLNKIFHYIPVPDDLPEQVVSMNTAMAEIGWLLPLVAISEIIGGVLFIIPRFRALGAIILFPVIIGILSDSPYSGSLRITLGRGGLSCPLMGNA